MPDLIIYHGSCYDGFTAAFLLSEHFPDAIFLPARYGRTPPDVTGTSVLIVDFSWKREAMIAMAEQARELIVLDHHKSAMQELEGLDFAVFDMERSGCRMAWDWLRDQGLIEGDADLPWLVEYVEDRDLWRRVLPDTELVHAYITSVPMTFEAWGDLADMDLDRVAEGGRAIRQSIDRYCERVGAEREIYDAGSHLGLVQVVNAPYLNASELAHFMLQNGTTDWTAAWFRRGDGLYQYSLRSNGAVDVPDVARRYGGGGHARAAGFESVRMPDELWRLVGSAP
jgi:nanoRNase/pAp phosphatase (c-di-AMP/oligoRNAs hydrolase)